MDSDFNFCLSMERPRARACLKPLKINALKKVEKFFIFAKINFAPFQCIFESESFYILLLVNRLQSQSLFIIGKF